MQWWGTDESRRTVLVLEGIIDASDTLPDDPADPHADLQQQAVC